MIASDEVYNCPPALQLYQPRLIRDRITNNFDEIPLIIHPAICLLKLYRRGWL